MKPITKLNLNMNPAVCENGSLVYAKNMKVDKDGCLINDCGYSYIDALSEYDIIGHIVGLNNKIYLFTNNSKIISLYEEEKFSKIFVGDDEYRTLYSGLCDTSLYSDVPLSSTHYYAVDIFGKTNENNSFKLSNLGLSTTDYDNNYFGFKIDYTPGDESKYFSDIYTRLKAIIQQFTNIICYDNKIVDNGILSASTVMYKIITDQKYVEEEFFPYIRIYLIDSTDNRHLLTSLFPEAVDKDNIGYHYILNHSQNINVVLEYNELTNFVKEIPCAWKYNGGRIDGCVTTNTTGEEILSIAEHIEGLDTDKNALPLKHINLSYCDYTDDESIYTQAPKVPIANLVLSDTYAKTIPNGVYMFFIRYEIRKDVYTNWYLCSRPMFAGMNQTINTIQGGVKYINLHKDSAKSFKFNISFVLEENKKLYNNFQLGFTISHNDSLNARIWKKFDINTTDIYFDYDNVEDIDIAELQSINYELYNVENIAPFKNKLYISNYIESNFNNEKLKAFAKAIDVRPVIKTNTVSAGSLKLNGEYVSKIGRTGHYDTLIDGSHDIQYLFASNDLNYNFLGVNVLNDDVAKKEALTIDFKMEGSLGLYTALRLTNNIRGHLYFGENFDYKSSENIFTVIKKVNVAANSGYRYIDNKSNNIHNWYELGFTYGYAKRSKTSDIYKINKDTKQSFVEGDSGWCCNFPNNIENEAKQLIIDDINSQRYFSVAYVYITYGTKRYNIGYISDYDSSDFIIENTNNIEINKEIPYTSDEIINKFKQTIINVVKSKIVGISEDKVPVFYLDGDYVESNNVSIVCKEYTFSTKEEDIEKVNVQGLDYDRFYVELNTKTVVYNFTYKFKDNIISLNSTKLDISKQTSTLMPHSTYKVYAHFVDEHNIISNGVYLKDISTLGIANDTETIELEYSTSTIDLDVVVSDNKPSAFFISLKKIGNNIIEGFAYLKKDNTHYLHSIELDSLLYNLNDNIIIINNNGDVITESAKYCSSGESNPISAFGNCGFVTWSDENDYSNDRLFIKIHIDEIDTTVDNLIKCSNYLQYKPTMASFISSGLKLAKTWNNIYNGYYGSYLCNIKKPSFELSNNTYVSGNDVYEVIRQYPLVLKEFDSLITVYDSKTYTIRSNFNLNYLSLTEDIDDKIFTLGNAANGQKQVAKVINSTILSFIYELKAMYKEFGNVYFREFTKYNKIKFDNTIRVSNTLSDESFNNSVFVFYPTDYYNIPTDRGIITKLFSINNSIMVHTKNSLYKFDTNAIIMSNETDVQLKQSDPFDKGIVQLFDSQFGYGGLDNKHSGCITFDSYFFYDKISKHIFACAGTDRLSTIDDTIQKFIKAYKPKDCKIIHDEENDRLLFEFIVDVDIENEIINGITPKNSFCISYNYKTKSFVSFHDLTLNKAFNSRFGCYSYNNKFLHLFDNNFNGTTLLPFAIDTWNIYGDATAISVFSFMNGAYSGTHSPYCIGIVMQPTTAITESLDSVNYIANFVKSYVESLSEFRILPNNEKVNPVDRFYVVTDLCISSEITSTIDKSVRPNLLNDYMGFNYNLGVWQGNYFRDTLNSNNVYSYPNQPGVGRDLVSDNNSLVYGRYFILVFEFIQDAIVKFEDVDINSKKY